MRADALVAIFLVASDTTTCPAPTFDIDNTTPQSLLLSAGIVVQAHVQRLTFSVRRSTFGYGQQQPTQPVRAAAAFA